MLVVSSCTGEKAVSHPQQLTLADFQDPELRLRREAVLGHLRRSAIDLYTGEQHRHVVAGMRQLRMHYGSDFVRLRIVSAGYGVVDESDGLLPYEATFNGMRSADARAWAQRLRIPEKIREAVSGFSLVVFLLGSKYLAAASPPVIPARGQRFVFLCAASEANRCTASSVTVVPAGVGETRVFGSGLVGLKGKMFRLFAQAVAQDVRHLEAIREDDTPTSFLAALRVAQHG